MNPIFCSSHYNPGVIGFSVIGVSEIERGTVGHISQEWIPAIPPAENHLIPSHVGDLYLIWEPFDAALDEIKAPVHSPLFPLCKQEMHSQTNPQQGFIRLPPFGEKGEKAPPFEVSDSLGECADTGQYNSICLLGNSGVGGNNYIPVHPDKGFTHALEISHGIVNHGDHMVTNGNNGFFMKLMKLVY